MVPKAQAAQIRFDSELKERKGIQIYMSQPICLMNLVSLHL